MATATATHQLTSHEVKSSLTSPELKESCDKFAVTAQLKKTAFYQDPNYRVVNAAGGYWDSWPTAGIIVGYDGSGMDTLLQTLANHCMDLPAFMRPHSVWVLNRGYLFWTKEGSSEMVHPMGDTVLNSNIINGEGNVLAMMLMALSQQFARVRLPAFRITDYLDPKEDLGIKGHMSVDMVFPEHAPLSFKLGVDPHKLSHEQLLELKNFNPRIREKRPGPTG